MLAVSMLIHTSKMHFWPFLTTFIIEAENRRGFPIHIPGFKPLILILLNNKSTIEMLESTLTCLLVGTP